MIRISEQPSNENDFVEYEVPYDVSVKKIEIFYTDATLLNGSTKWDSFTIKNTSNLSQYIPDTAKNAFISVTDSRNLIVSSALF